MERPLSNIELLAPAGGMEQLQAAVLFGADAVYLALDRFGMRARATNFSLDTLGEAVSYAHEHHTKVYVTCNILMTADDIDALPAYLCALNEANIDALIVSDMGAFALACEYMPQVNLHVSTQASVANAAAAQAWYNLGAKRVVCAREMSLSDIARMRQDVPADLELEAFVHGAMCMAISGRCLISAYLTGRSANEGYCTQPCRWSYTLEEEKRPDLHFPIEQDEHGTFIMNAKDLNMIEYLDDLARVGINAIKIEGRNKKAFYVAGVVGAYRRVLNGEQASEVKDELLAISHRPYGTGFYFGEAQQACDFEGYEQETLHVADVLDCVSVDTTDQNSDALSAVLGDVSDSIFVTTSDDETYSNEGIADRYWCLTVRCRNRFEEGDELEILRPKQAAAHVIVRNLVWLTDDGLQPESKNSKSVSVANRASEQYCFIAEGLDTPVCKGSFLRKRVYRRSAGCE